MIILISISFCKRKLTKKYLLWHTFFISSIEIRRCFLTPFDVLSECRLMYRQCARQLCTTYNFFSKSAEAEFLQLIWVEKCGPSLHLSFLEQLSCCADWWTISPHTQNLTPHNFMVSCWMKNSNELLKKFLHMKTQNSFFFRFSFWSISDLLH